MVLKKCNAVLTWLSGLCLVAHLGTMSYSMLTGWYDYSLCKGLARGTASFTSLHFIVTIIIFFFLHDGTNLMQYKKQNANTILQRVTAILMMVFLHLHLKAFGFISSGTALSGGGKLFLIVTEAVFFGSCLLHLTVSIPKSLITLGLLREEKTEKTIKSAAGIFCGLLYVFSMVALIVFVSGWTGF